MADYPLNKTMDRDDLSLPECRKIVVELFELMRWMQENDLPYSAWIGTLGPDPVLDRIQRINRGPDYEPLENAFDDERVPWFLLWEISWLASHAGLEPGMKVLDMGGSGSLFSCYLAWKGIDVTSIDIDAGLVAVANGVAVCANWPLRALEMDMTAMTFEPASFDRIFSVCVYEHLPRELRVKANWDILRLLRPGGRFCITFDYQNPEKVMAISSPQDVREQFLGPLGLTVLGNQAFVDNGKRYLLHPWFADAWTRFKRVARRRIPLRALWNTSMGSYTFASLFLEKGTN